MAALTRLSRSPRWILLATVLLAIMGTSAVMKTIAAQETATEPSLSDRVTRIFDHHDRDGDLERAWLGASRLEELDFDAVPFIQERLESDSKIARLMAAKALLDLEPDGVDRVLIQLGTDGETAEPIRVAALKLLAAVPGNRADRALKKLLESDDVYSPALRIAAAGSLSRFERKLARAQLVPLLDTDDVSARRAAALVLARLGSPDPRVRQVLFSLQFEPTPEGAQARLLLENEQLLSQMERMMDTGSASSDPVVNNLIEDLQKQIESREDEIEDLQEVITRTKSNTPPLIEELLELVYERYASPGKLDREQLVIEAAKGMIASLDPYSSFMDVEDTKSFNEDMAGEYAGIGAEVGSDPESGYLLILRPLYNGPAYRAGLRTDDQVTEVAGIRVKNLPFEEKVKHLKGPPGTTVEVKVLRRGWNEERTIEIQREVIQVESAIATMLPGKLGYVSLSRFGQNSIDEVEDALDRLEADGMQGLILDLRNNPGGYLKGAVRLVDAFVDKRDEPIVTQRADSDFIRPRRDFAKDGKRGDYPIVILINGGSASAAEIVSGALQDYGRATLVGTQSFGKGSVQRIIPMKRSLNEKLGGDTNLRLTVQYYYLPSGRSIHTRRDANGRVTEKGGVTPDVEVEPVRVPVYRLEAVEKMNRDGLFRSYIADYFDNNKALFETIANRGDNGDPTQYPGFTEHFAALKETPALPDDVRYELRQQIRRRFEDARGKQFACDYPEDLVLQRAIMTTLEKLGRSADSIDEYRAFAAAAKKEDKKKESKEF